MADIVLLIKIPPHATNGDVIKAMFPNAEFEQGGEYIDMVMSGNSTFEIDWWNAPYKAESEK